MTTLPIILDHYLRCNCITNYQLLDKVIEDYDDIDLGNNQVALVYELYHEYKGISTISTDDKENILSLNPSSAIKNTYTDKADQVKTFVLHQSVIIKKSFTFSGSGINPHLKYLLITNLDT